MVYEMRTINAKDIFPFVSIIYKIGIDEIAECFGRDKLTKLVKDVQTKTKNKKDAKAETVSEIGVDVVLKIVSIILKNMSKIEDDLFEFFASITGQNKETIENMAFEDFIEQIKEFIKKPEFDSFIKAASKYTN